MHLARTAIVAAILATANSAHAVEYQFTTFDVPGALSTQLFGINNHGHFVGAYADTNGSYGFMFDGSATRLIAHPSGADTILLDINDASMIVGKYGDLLTPSGFLLTGGTFQDLAFPGASWTIAHGINNLGTIVGSYGGPTLSSPTHGFILSGMNYQSVTAPDSDTTGLYGINDVGLVVGRSLRPPSIGFTFENGKFSPVGFGNTLPTDISSRRGIVGTDLPDPFSANRRSSGFLIDGDSSLEISFPGATDTFVEGINDSSTLVGSYRNAEGKTHGFYAVVVPEPSALSLFIAALLMMLLGASLCAIRGRQSSQ